MRYAVKPREPTRYDTRRPEPSVKPSSLPQSLFDKTADGFGAVFGEIVFSGPSVDPGQRGGCEPEGNELVPRCRSPASFLYNICCIGHGLVYNNINSREQDQ